MNISQTKKISFKRSSFIKISMFGFLFLFIYTPLVILPFNVLHVLSIVSLYFLLTKYQKKFFQILMTPVLFFFIAVITFITIYSFSLNPLSANNLGITYQYAVIILEVLPCAIFSSFVLLEHKIDLNKLYDILLFIGMLQVVCVVLTMIFPELREWIIESSGSQRLEDTYEKVNFFRIYGFARGYTFGMPLFQGLCLIIAFVLGAYKSSKYYLLIPFFMFSIAVNARMAFVSLLIVPCVVFFFRFKINPIKQIAGILFISFSLLMLAKFIQYMAEGSSLTDTWFWLNQGVEELINFQEGEKTGNLAALTDTMWFMPKEIYELIFGTGELVSGRGGGMSSDIGYVINLYYGGFVFSFFIYFSYLYILVKFYNNNMIEKNMSLSFIIYLFIANAKGNVFISNESVNGVLLLIVFSIAYRRFYQTEFTNKFYGSHCLSYGRQTLP